MNAQVRGDVQLQYVLIPPDAALAAQQLQSLMSTPTLPAAASTVQARPTRGANRIEELAKAKSRHGRAASRGQSADSATDVDAEELDSANKQAQFLRAQSRRTRIVPPPERVDYSKVQSKTKSRPSKVNLMKLLALASVTTACVKRTGAAASVERRRHGSASPLSVCTHSVCLPILIHIMIECVCMSWLQASLSPPHHADGAARTKVSKIQIDLSKAVPEHMERPRTAAHEASQHVRSASSSRRYYCRVHRAALWWL